MWIETRTGRDVRAVNIVHAHGDIAGPRSLAPSPSVASPSAAPGPVPAPVPQLPAYVVHDGVRHLPIDVLPWDVVTFRTICGQDVTADEHASREVTDCAWCGWFEEAHHAYENRK